MGSVFWRAVAGEGMTPVFPLVVAAGHAKSLVALSPVVLLGDESHRTKIDRHPPRMTKRSDPFTFPKNIGKVLCQAGH